MVAPVVIGIALGALWVGSQIAASVATGYAIDKTLGDGKYTRREFAVDAVMGAIPGVGLLRPTGKILYSARYLRHYDRAVDTPGMAARGLAYYNRAPIMVIAKTIATEKGVEILSKHLELESTRRVPSSSQQGRRRGGTSKKFRLTQLDIDFLKIPTRKVTWKSGKKGGKKRPSCPKGFRLRRVGKRLMCVKS